MLKSVVFILLIGLGLALAAQSIYYSTWFRGSGLEWLSRQERISQVREGRTEKFSFYCQPTGMRGLKIDWTKDYHRCGPRALKLTFLGAGDKTRIGIRLFASVKLKDYVEKGTLDFWVKGGDNFSSLNLLKVYLRDWPGYIGEAAVYLPLSLRPEWQKISLPLSSFKITKLNQSHREDFTWHISEISFSANAFSSADSAEVYIDCLRFLEYDKIVSELL